MKLYKWLKKQKRKKDPTFLFLLLFVLALIKVYASEIMAVLKVAIVVWLGVPLYKAYNLKRSDLSEVDQLDPFGFEDYIGELFRIKGYSALVTRRSGDFGADVLARDLRGQRIAIQVKHTKQMQSVGVEAIQEVVGAKGYYKCNRAIIITNAQFTKNAIKLARGNRVELWNRERLGREIRNLRLVRPVSSA